MKDQRDRGEARGRLSLIATASITALALLGCAPEQYGTWPAQPRDALDPSGARLLDELAADEDVEAAVAWTAIEIAVRRPQGVSRALEALKAQLAPLGLDVSALDRVAPAQVAAALTGRGPAPTTARSGVGRKQQALSGDQIAAYFDCPLLAPENNIGTECDKAVEAIVVQVKNEIERDYDNVYLQIAAIYDDLPRPAHQFLTSWALEAELVGARLAGIYAAQELRAALQCDDKTNAHLVAYQLGVEQGVQIVEELTVWAETQLSSCLVNTDVIAEQVRTIARSKVKRFMSEHKVCVDADLSAVNSALKEAETIREEGIISGIDQRVEILRVKLFEERKQLPCYCDIANFSLEQCPAAGLVGGAPAAPTCWVDTGGWRMTRTSHPDFRYGGWVRTVDDTDFCCRIKGGREVCVGKWPNGQVGYCQLVDGCLRCDCKHRHVGSPLVLDLDDDGVSFAERSARFDLLADGAPLRTSWVGPREPLLAVDLDGDGQITSGAELFGNYAACDGARCFDGVAALAAWDAPDRGGNGDGRIDAQDEIWARLSLWTDADGDGVTAPGELQLAAAAGVQAIALQADRRVQQLQLGTVSARLEVLTERGRRTAHDVWFRTRPTAANLAGALLPRR